MTPQQTAEGLSLDDLERLLVRLLPITINDTPDYAEVTFGEAKVQAMTLEPDTLLALNALPRLISELRAAREEGWQDISTAPNWTSNMRQVLLFWPEAGVCCGWLDVDDDFDQRPKSWRSPRHGWRSGGDQCIPINQPTHWRPLPAPPAHLAAKGTRA